MSVDVFFVREDADFGSRSSDRVIGQVGGPGDVDVIHFPSVPLRGFAVSQAEDQSTRRGRVEAGGSTDND